MTEAQERVIAEIKRDMTAERPMNRLVQGDVGSGKTIVALIAALMAVENGYQACIMAPTEILAEQHYKNISALAEPLGITVRSLTGRMKKKEKEALLAEIASGAAQIVVGTHALDRRRCVLQAARPGRDRRTAPVRRDAALDAHVKRVRAGCPGHDRDADSAHAGAYRLRRPGCFRDRRDAAGQDPDHHETVFRIKAKEAYQFIESELKKGRQVYVVYPLVEETEKSDLKAATEMAAHLQKDIFPKWKVGLAARQDEIR